MPGMGTLFLAAFAAGVLQSIIPIGQFVGVPNGLNQMFSYPIAFCIGIAAKHGAWLEAVKEKPASSAIFLRFIVLVAVGVIVAYWVENREIMAQTGGNTDSLSHLSLFVMGFLCVTMSWALLQYFQCFCTGAGVTMRVATSAAYTVYLVHPYFIICGAWAYVRILDLCGVEVTQLVMAAPGVPTFAPGYIIHSSNEVFMWLAFLFTTLFCLIFCWPVAYVLAKLPGLRLIL